VSSRDGSDRSDRPRRSSQTGRQQNQPRQQPQGDTGATWDIDPAEIDRYLSGRPSRERDTGSTPPARSPRPDQGRKEGTADQLDRLRRAVSEGHETTQQRPARPRQTQRSQSTQDVRGTQRSATGREQFAAPSQQQPLRRQTTRQDRPPRRRDDVLRQDPFAESPDVGYDDELYSDDPYIDQEYEDDWVEPAPRRSASRTRPRPQVRLSKPNIPRPTMPAAISNAALANDTTSLALIGTGLLGLAFMAVIVSNRLEASPEVIATHVSASGALEDMRGRNALWRIPVLSSMLMLMNIVAAWFFATIDRFAARFMLGASLVVQFIAWVAVIRYLW
jgi:hypothetical protein